MPIQSCRLVVFKLSCWGASLSRKYFSLTLHFWLLWKFIHFNYSIWLTCYFPTFWNTTIAKHSITDIIQSNNFVIWETRFGVSIVQLWALTKSLNNTVVDIHVHYMCVCSHHILLRSLLCFVWASFWAPRHLTPSSSMGVPWCGSGQRMRKECGQRTEICRWIKREKLCMLISLLFTCSTLIALSALWYLTMAHLGKESRLHLNFHIFLVCL